MTKKILILIASPYSNKRSHSSKGSEWRGSWWMHIKKNDGKYFDQRNNFDPAAATFFYIIIPDEVNIVMKDSIAGTSDEIDSSSEIKPSITYYTASDAKKFILNESLPGTRILIVVNRQEQDEIWSEVLKNIWQMIKEQEVMIACHCMLSNGYILNYSSTDKTVWSNMMALRYGGIATDKEINRCNAFDELWKHFSTKSPRTLKSMDADTIISHVTEAITGETKSQKTYSNLKHSIINKISSWNILLDNFAHKSFQDAGAEEKSFNEDMKTLLENNKINELRNLLYGKNGIESTIQQYKKDKNILNKWEIVQSLLPFSEATSEVANKGQINNKYSNIEDILKGKISLEILRGKIKGRNLFSEWYDDFLAALNDLQNALPTIKKQI